MKAHTKENSVSPVVGIAFLIAIAVILSALVFTTTGGILTEQQAPSAGANVTIASESTIQVQLDSVQNADNVYVQSPLGTQYELEEIGDTVEILNIGNEQKPVLIAEKDGKEHVVQGITPRSFDVDYVVNPENGEDFDTIQAAINTAKSNDKQGEIIAVAREQYKEDITVDTELTLVAEDGTAIEHSGSNNNVVTVESEGAGSTITNFNIDAESDTETAQNGFNVNGEEVTLKSNQVKNATGKAFNLNASSNTVIRNIATSNGKGLSIQEGAGTHVIRNNDFSGNGLGAENLDAGTADLRKNKWGVENPQEVVSGSTVTSKSEFAGRFIGDLKEKITVKNRPRGVGASTVTGDGDLVAQSGGNQSLDWFSTEITIFVDGEPITVRPNGTHSFEVVEDSSGQADKIFNSQKVMREGTSSDSGQSNDVTTLDSGEKIAFDLNEEETSNSDVSVVVEGQPSSDGIDGGSNNNNNNSSDGSNDSSSTSGTETITVTDTTPSSVNSNSDTSNSPGGSNTDSNNSDSTTVKTQSDLEPPQDGEMTNSPSHEVDAGPGFSAVSNQELKFIAAVEGVNPEEVSFTWDFDDGTTKTGQEATHIYEEPGEYRVSVTSEYNGEKSGDSLTVDISEGGVEENYAPIVRGEVITEPPFEVGGSVEFSASNSFDPDGSIASYKWDFNNDGEFESTGETASYKFESEGEHTVRLELVDNNGATSSTTKTLETHPSAPNADFTVTSETPLSRSSASTFDASPSSDFDGSIESYEWDFDGDGTTDATGETASYNFSVAGTVDVTLTVTDNDGKQGEVTKSVEISNESPNASYTASSTVVQSGVPVELDASASSDPEGDALSYEWEFSDGSTATGEVVEHAFSGNESQTAKLTVTDEFGASSTHTETFTATSDCKRFGSNTVLSAGTHNYACVVVESGVTVTTRGDPSEDGPNSYGGVKIKTHGDIIVNGKLNGVGQGYPEGSGPGGQNDAGSYGGAGYTRWEHNTVIYGSTGEANRLGSGGNGGYHNPANPGGGSVWLTSSAGKVTVNGRIEMDSPGGANDEGSGGSIRIEAPEVTGNGVLSAAARTAQPGGRGGGGGRIFIEGGNSKNYNFNIDVSGSANSYGNNSGEDGTLTRQPVINDIEFSADIGSTGYTSSFTPRYNDPDGDSVNFHWDFGDGDTSTAKYPNHVYTETGTYTITLTVTDEHGASSTYTEEYTVEDIGSCTVFDSNTTLTAGTYEYPCVEVTSGTTVTTQGNPSEDGPNSYGGVKIKTHGDIVVNGTLNGVGQGYPEGSGPGGQNDAGSYGGAGYTRWEHNTVIYGSTGEANRLGSGGNGGYHNPANPGGGSVWLVSENGEVNVDGRIEMDSPGGANDEGSGGSIRIEAPKVTGSGTLSAAARTAQPGGRGGGGGRILIDGGNSKNYNFNIDVSGSENSYGNNSGEDGTLTRQPVINDIEFSADVGSTGYTSSFTPKYNDPDGDSVSFHWDFGDGDTSTAKYPNHTYTETGTYTITLTVTDQHGVSSTYTEEYTVEDIGTCTVFDSNTTLTAGTYEYPCVEITSGTTVTTRGDPSEDGANSYGGVKIKTHGDIIVNGKMNGVGQGYPEGSGPGGQNDAGSYGGAGYTRWEHNTVIYGSPHEANRLGSGGNGGYHNPANPGGGSVWLVSENGKVSVDGRIEMDSPGGANDEGSGGSIRIEAPEVTGNGVLSAAARTAQPGGRGGGGGRILIDAGNKSYNFNIDASGSANSYGNNSGEDGTIVEK